MQQRRRRRRAPYEGKDPCRRQASARTARARDTSPYLATLSSAQPASGYAPAISVASSPCGLGFRATSPRPPVGAPRLFPPPYDPKAKGDPISSKTIGVQCAEVFGPQG